ncbi:MAG: phosphotransferase [Fibrobacteraceae bacterium]|nr:phosphotransferase [Fibrobacteraceae bacterium]
MNNEELIISEKINGFLATHGYVEKLEISSIAGAGSGRRYYRVKSGSKVSVLQVNPELGDEKKKEDFDRFVDYSKTFREIGIAVPRVYVVDEKAGQILQEDFGDRTLLDYVSPIDPQSGNVRILYQEVIDSLVSMQSRSTSLFLSRADIGARKFDYASLKWETDYFTENYLGRHVGITELPPSVRHLFATLACIVDSHPKVLMHRDLQSQNIMVRPNSEVGFVDFQGARRGSMYYDLASLLWDPYVCLPLDLVKDFFDYWYKISGIKDYTKEEAWESFIQASLQRVMQALGAYCFLSKVKKIEKFEKYIEPGKERLRLILAEFRKTAKVATEEVFQFMEKALA